MAALNPIFRSAFQSPDDEFNESGVRPMVLDVIGPDGETSLMPDGLRMVLHVNPKSMAISHSKVIERIQTKGGYVEQHWGSAAGTISLDAVTGGFKRLFSGLSNTTGGAEGSGTGTRRDSIAYDKFLDLQALYHNNGAIRDRSGQIVLQGSIKLTFDGGSYLGIFTSFSVTESADIPYMFNLTAAFTIQQELARMRSLPWNSSSSARTQTQAQTQSIQQAAPATFERPPLQAAQVGSGSTAKFGKAEE